MPDPRAGSSRRDAAPASPDRKNCRIKAQPHEDQFHRNARIRHHHHRSARERRRDARFRSRGAARRSRSQPVQGQDRADLRRLCRADGAESVAAESFRERMSRTVCCGGLGARCRVGSRLARQSGGLPQKHFSQGSGFLCERILVTADNGGDEHGGEPMEMRAEDEDHAQQRGDDDQSGIHRHADKAVKGGFMLGDVHVSADVFFSHDRPHLKKKSSERGTYHAPRHPPRRCARLDW